MFLSLLTNQGSITLSLATSSSGIPTISASTTSKIIWSVGFLSRSFRTREVVRPRRSRLITPSYLMLSILAAFWIASSKPLPIAITSPIDFIAVPIPLEAPSNFLVSHLGIFTTT